MKREGRFLHDVGLAKTWLEPAKALMNRLEKFFRYATPASRKKMGQLAYRINYALAIGLCVSSILWAIVDKPCNNGCGEWVSDPSGAHLGQCSNCDRSIWKCPTLSHPHQSDCKTCGNAYWDCPGKSEALLHGIYCQFFRESSQKQPHLNSFDGKLLDR